MLEEKIRTLHIGVYSVTGDDEVIYGRVKDSPEPFIEGRKSLMKGEYDSN